MLVCRAVGSLSTRMGIENKQCSHALHNEHAEGVALMPASCCRRSLGLPAACRPRPYHLDQNACAQAFTKQERAGIQLVLRVPLARFCFQRVSNHTHA
eukprot:3760027-Alexandrium_andersonii.AAC.1